MKYKWTFALLFMPCLGLASCMEAAHEPSGNDATMNKEHVLIVYLSRTNNSKAVAEIIHDAVGGTLVEFELKTPYPENYDTIVAQVVREDETDYLPPLKTKIANFGNYDTVFLGFPTWNM